MRVSLLCIVALLGMAALVAAQAPVAPVIKRQNLAGDITSCPIGQGLATAAKPYKCAPCKAGYYKADTSLTGCLPCVKNTWSPQGDKQCYLCPEGTSTEGATAAVACTECAYGEHLSYKWSTANVDIRCKKCPKNEYQPLAGQNVCLKCPAGMTTQDAEGSGECYAVGGGNTIDSDNKPKPGAPAASLIQTLASKITVAQKPAIKGVKPASAAPTKPQIVKRASYKGKSPRPQKPNSSGVRAAADALARSNAKKAKASKAKKSL